MAVNLNSNLAALRVQRALATTTSSLQKSFERLSSGLRINRASDDAAGLAISSSLNTDSRVFSQAIRNVNDSISYYNIASGGLSQLSSITQRLIELSEQAANGVYSNSNRLAADKEAGALIEEFNRITATTSFNGASLLAGTSSQLSVQAGFGTINFDVTDQIERYKGSFSFEAKQTSGISFASAVVGEFDSTYPEYLDIVYTTGTAMLAVASGNGDGTFANDIFQPTSILAKGLTGGDFNRDGYKDVLVRDNLGSYQLALGSSSSLSSPLTAQSTGLTNLNDIQTGDLNGDGNLDFVVVNSSGQGRAFLGNGSGSFSAGTTFSNGRGGGANVAVGDFNGDGLDDIAMTSASYIDVLSSRGNGAFSSMTSIAVTSPQSIKAADFNGDGYADLAYGTTTTINVALNNRTNSFAAATTTSGSGLVLGVGDIDGDGITDLMSPQYLFKGNRDGTLTNVGTHQLTASVLLTTADLNNDGVQDLFGDVTGSQGSQLQTRSLTTDIQNQFLSTRTSALAALTYFKQVLANINKEQGATGASLSRLESVTNVFIQSRENYMAAASRITDADVAEESAALVRNRILQQAGSSLLGQANQQPALALQLLRGR